MKVQAAIKDIIRLNEHIRNFWSDGGWALGGAAELLARSRLDWQVSLSKSLLRWSPVPDGDEHDGALILAWANLGALVEGTMMWFLSVFHEDYEDFGGVTRKRSLIEPDELHLHRLCQFFAETVWTASQKERWEPFVSRIRERRNAIHAYKDRSIGTAEEFGAAVIEYRSFLLEHEGQVPYPDDEYTYPCDILKMHENERQAR